MGNFAYDQSVVGERLSSPGSESESRADWMIRTLDFKKLSFLPKYQGFNCIKKRTWPCLTSNICLSKHIFIRTCQNRGRRLATSLIFLISYLGKPQVSLQGMLIITVWFCLFSYVHFCFNSFWLDLLLCTSVCNSASPKTSWTYLLPPSCIPEHSCSWEQWNSQIQYVAAKCHFGAYDCWSSCEIHFQ